jgi:hypothetical protein
LGFTYLGPRDIKAAVTAIGSDGKIAVAAGNNVAFFWDRST